MPQSVIARNLERRRARQNTRQRLLGQTCMAFTLIATIPSQASKTSSLTLDMDWQPSTQRANTSGSFRPAHTAGLPAAIRYSPVCSTSLPQRERGRFARLTFCGNATIACDSAAKQDYNGVWVIDHIDPNYRFEMQGEIVKSSGPILIRHV